MNEDQEKRYKGYKYIDCFCDKHENILAGGGNFMFLKVLFMVAGIFFTLFVLFFVPNIWFKLLIFMIFILMCILMFYDYKTALGIMIQAGHTKECSYKIARIYMFNSGQGAKFTIMKTKDDGKRVWR